MIKKREKTGKWLIEGFGCCEVGLCSKCGIGIERSDVPKFKYCPNCGTKMKGAEKSGG